MVSLVTELEYYTDEKGYKKCVVMYGTKICSINQKFMKEMQEYDVGSSSNYYKKQKEKKGGGGDKKQGEKKGGGGDKKQGGGGDQTRNITYSKIKDTFMTPVEALFTKDMLSGLNPATKSYSYYFT